MFRDLDRFLHGLSATALLSVSLALIALLGWIDYQTGRELSFSIFYTAPIALVTWYVGKRAGVLIALVAAAVWLEAEINGGAVYSHPLIPFWNSMVRLAFFLWITLLLGSIRERLDAEEKLADTDPLTGLFNVHSFYEQVHLEQERSARYRHPLTIAYFDLDNFKAVNDAQGHDTGDDVLRTVANTLRRQIRLSDAIARLGGDEFAGLFPETDRDAAEALIHRHILPHLLVAMKERGWPITFSIGAVTFEKPLETAREMIKAADDLMYTVKRGGKNNVLLKQWEPPEGTA